MNPGHMDLMIKVYQDGICTPSLSKLEEGDELEISDPIGDKNFDEWICNSEQLILLAAGSGITPMIDIMARRIEKNFEKQVYLLMFNKTEKDVQTLEAAEEHGWDLSKWMRMYDGSDKIVVSFVESAAFSN